MGLIITMVSFIVWFTWLFFGLYSDFGVMGQVRMNPTDQPFNNIWMVYDFTHFVYYALIIVFAIGILLLLGEYSRKSLKKSLIILTVSCLLWWLSQSISIWFFWSLCWWCKDHIGYVLFIFFLLFFILWFLSLFFVVRYLYGNKWAFFFVWMIFTLIGVLSVYLFGVDRYSFFGGFIKWIKITYWLLFTTSIVLCIVAWIKSYKDAKKSN